jgi:hypothetical protein
MLVYSDAQALSEAAHGLPREDSSKLLAVALDDGSFEVDGPADVLAKLQAGPSAERLLAYLAEKRWRLETGGYLWNGHLVATDRDSRSIIGQERLAISLGERADPDGFKMGGELVMVSNADFIAMTDAIRAFVRACFAAEAMIAAQILAGTITSFAAIDAAAMPSNGS